MTPGAGWRLRDRGDRRHQQAAAAFKSALAGEVSILTTDYVLDETFTLLFRRLAFHKAKESVDFLMMAMGDGSVVLASVYAARFRQAVKLRLKYKDKPEISFTDFTSMSVMVELGMKRILTEDRHFAQVGMGFELVP